MVRVGVMPRSRADKLLDEALRLARKAMEERASADDLEELALVVLELDEHITVEGRRAPKRWTKGAV
jgi:hypothetical protein